MNFAQPLMEFAGLIVGLALVGLILARSNETATVVTSAGSAFEGLLNAASMGASQPVRSSRRNYGGGL